MEVLPNKKNIQIKDFEYQNRYVFLIQILKVFF